MGCRRPIPFAALLGAVLAGGLLAGCASGRSGGVSSTPGGSVPASQSPFSGPETSPANSPETSAPQPPPGLTKSPVQPTQTGEMTLTGTVEEGVELNCLIMRAQGKVYQLMGGDRNVVKAGATVWVRGRVDKGVVSYCQQGEPFQVLEARPA
jgi:hypothetical protein